MAPTLESNILDVVLINNIDKINDKQPREHFSTSDHNVVSFGFNLSNKKWLPELLTITVTILQKVLFTDLSKSS